MTTIVGTLGPEGTNSELACIQYLKGNNISGNVNLYSTPEMAIDALINNEIDTCILCIVYPKLNEIVFRNLELIELVDTYLMPTYPMVIAGNLDGKRFCSHPAPVDLIDNNKSIELVNSNAEAAKLCKGGYFDACVTTRKAAELHELVIAKDYGEVNMGWAVFNRKQKDLKMAV